MPECAEVQLYTDALQKEYGGKTIRDMKIVGGRYLKETIQNYNIDSIPMEEISFHCRGKFLYWKSSDKELNLAISLGMTGSFSKEKQKHSAIQFTFDDDSVLYFNDIRRFGRVKFVDEKSLLEKLSYLKWDVLKEEAPQNINTLIRVHGNCSIGIITLSQEIFSGIGNYLRNEILYRAKISPLRLAKDLSNEDIIKICNETKNVTRAAYDSGGASLLTYTDFYGKRGNYSEQFQVYGRKHTPDGKKIVKTKLAGRSIFYVPEFQK